MSHILDPRNETLSLPCYTDFTNFLKIQKFVSAYADCRAVV